MIKRILPFFVILIAAASTATGSLVEETDLGYQYNWYSYQSYKTEDIRVAFDFSQITAGNFYGNLSSGHFLDMTAVESKIISRSKNAAEFFAGLKDFQNNIDVQQKLLLLQRLGWYLEANYNSALALNNQHVKISDDEMFSALRGYFIDRKITPSGICGNIHAFLIKTAENLGIEAWLQNGITRRNNGHVFAGLIVERDNQKQIAFLDYKNLILTGTTRYDEALGVMERYFGQVSLFHSFVETKDKVLFPVKSLATKKLESVVGYQPADEMLSNYLAAGEIKSPRRVLSLKTGNEIKQASYDSEHFGVAVTDFHDAGNPYNSLDSFKAIRGYLRFAGQNIEIKIGNTDVNAEVKDLGDKTVNQNFIVPIINLNYINFLAFTSNLSLNYGVSFETGLRSPESYFGEAAAGTRLVYVFDAGSIFLEGIEGVRGQLSDFQDQELAVKLMSRQLKIGGSLKLQSAVMHLETALAKTDASVKESASLGFKAGRVKTVVSYEKENSNFLRFIPDKSQINLEVGYMLSREGKPFGEFSLYEASIWERYEDSSKRPSYETGVMMKIFLW